MNLLDELLEIEETKICGCGSRHAGKTCPIKIFKAADFKTIRHGKFYESKTHGIVVIHRSFGMSDGVVLAYRPEDIDELLTIEVSDLV